MPARAPTSSSSTLMRPFVVLALPGMYLLYKYNQYRQQQMETARRRVTERELMHLNTKIIAQNPVPFGLTGSSAVLYCKHENFVRNYKKTGRACDSPCRRALKDIPEPVDPICPAPCEEKRPKKKKGILYKIKLKIIEGGTNFGMPFRRLQFKDRKPDTDDDEEEKEVPVTSSLPVPTEDLTIPSDPRPGVQVSILGAETGIGQYCALLLKQCPHVKKLRLYQSSTEGCACPPGNITNPCRDMYNIAQDLLHIDTNCGVKAFSCCNPCDLELCLQNTDIVLMLESGNVNATMPPEKRFEFQAPLVKLYADAIAAECPKAMVLVCTTPIDCMVPLVAETMKEMGWYDKRKLIGSMAVQEMRASTLAGRALSLDPLYTRVPCVGGTEGEALVPLFSKAIRYFDFSRKNAEMMTETVRCAPFSMTRCESGCNKTADLSEAHALSGLVKNVAHALLCQDVPRISGFVETDASQIISPARFIANKIELNGSGIMKYFGLPMMSDTERRQAHLAINVLENKLELVYQWYGKYKCSTVALDSQKTTDWFTPGRYKWIDDLAYSAVYLALDVLLNRHGICKKFDLPAPLSEVELDLMDGMWGYLMRYVCMGQKWHQDYYVTQWQQNETQSVKNFNIPQTFDHVKDCACQLSS